MESHHYNNAYGQTTPRSIAPQASPKAKPSEEVRTLKKDEAFLVKQIRAAAERHGKTRAIARFQTDVRLLEHFEEERRKFDAAKRRQSDALTPDGYITYHV